MDQTTNAAKSRSCYKCGFYGVTPETICPQCNRLLFTATSTRVRGFLMILCGAALVAILGYISIWALAAVNSDGTIGTRFTGTQREQVIIFALFGAIILFGFGSFITGVGQLVTGRRNKVLAWAVVGIGCLVFVIAGSVYWFF